MALLRADPDTAVQADLVSLNRPSILQRYYRHRYLFALMAAALVWTIIFKYGPMYGIIIAFKRYRFFDGIWGSPWVGLDHFVRLFNGTTDFCSTAPPTSDGSSATRSSSACIDCSGAFRRRSSWRCS